MICFLVYLFLFINVHFFKLHLFFPFSSCLLLTSLSHLTFSFALFRLLFICYQFVLPASSFSLFQFVFIFCSSFSFLLLVYLLCFFLFIFSLFILVFLSSIPFLLIIHLCFLPFNHLFFSAFHFSFVLFLPTLLFLVILSSFFLHLAFAHYSFLFLILHSLPFPSFFRFHFLIFFNFSTSADFSGFSSSSFSIHLISPTSSISFPPLRSYCNRLTDEMTSDLSCECAGSGSNPSLRRRCVNQSTFSSLFALVDNWIPGKAWEG